MRVGHPGTGERRAHLRPVEAGQIEVEHEHVRHEGTGAGHGCAPVVGSRDDVEAGVGEVTGHGVAPHRVVVGDDDRDVVGGGPPLLLSHDTLTCSPSLPARPCRFRTPIVPDRGIVGASGYRCVDAHP